MRAFIGSGQLLKGIDKNLIGMTVGESKEIDLSQKMLLEKELLI